MGFRRLEFLCLLVQSLGLWGREFRDSSGEFLMRHAVSCKEEILNPKL